MYFPCCPLVIFVCLCLFPVGHWLARMVVGCQGEVEDEGGVGGPTLSSTGLALGSGTTSVFSVQNKQIGKKNYETAMMP